MGVELITVKLLEPVARPPGATTLIGPEVALGGTTAVIRLSEFTVKEALVPLNETVEAEVKPLPEITTLAFV